MAHPSIFGESWHRVKRAQLHRNAFADHWNMLINRDAYEFIVEHATDGTGKIRFRRHGSMLYDALLELGEFFYQLRAALDCLAFTGVKNKIADPITYEDHIYFPIVSAESEYKSRASCLRELPHQLRAWIKSVQPYIACESDDDRTRRIGRLLKLLHDCARKDRHKRLTVISALTSEMSGGLTFSPEVRLLHIDGTACNLFEMEGVLADFRLAEYVPGLHVDLDANLAINVLMEGVLFSGPQFSQGLSSLIEVVVFAIDRFEQAFVGPYGSHAAFPPS